MKFFTDSTEVIFSGINKVFNVSSVFCEIPLPFLSSPIIIRWYGVIIAFGFTLAVLFGGRTAYKWKINISKMLDVLIYGAFGGIIGARAYYVLSEWDYYGAYPAEIVKIWHGGLAIYGGLIGGLIAAFIVCRVEKINILNLLDLCGMSFLIGQGIGRWGNFANQEAFGINTDLPWGMYSEKTHAYLSALVSSGTSLNVDPSKPVHPTFLYESIWCILSFVILYITLKKFRKFSGQLFLMYGILYGLERAVVEGLRTDSLYLGTTNIRTSQLVSIILVVVCGILFTVGIIKYSIHPKPIEGIDYFTEFPVYRKKKKAVDARTLVLSLRKKRAALGESDDSNRAKALDRKIENAAFNARKLYCEAFEEKYIKKYN